MNTKELCSKPKKNYRAVYIRIYKYFMFFPNIYSSACNEVMVTCYKPPLLQRTRLEITAKACQRWGSMEQLIVAVMERLGQREPGEAQEADVKRRHTSMERDL